jgi:hypothetical protein
MKYLGTLSLWNADQWTMIRFPHNWLQVDRSPNLGVISITVFGFTLFFGGKK